MKNLKKIFAIFLVITLILTSAILFNAKSVSATTLKLNKTKITLSAGKSVNLKVLNTDKPIKWLTSDKIVATVSPKGKVTGKNAGTAFITVKVGKQNLQCKVTVKAALNLSLIHIFAGNNFSTIEISENVSVIESGAFKDCKKLQKIKIPDTAKNIGTMLFGNCIKLTDAELPQGIERITEGLFAGCTSLEQFSVPDTVQLIEDLSLIHIWYM